MNIFFTSDTHFGHANIIKYCNRPWLHKGDLDSTGRWISTNRAALRVKEMNKAIIANWNRVVKKEDVVYHLGDFCFKSANKKGNGIGTAWEEYESQLNGKIIFIRGNHDTHNKGSSKSLIVKATIRYGGFNILLIHHPERVTPFDTCDMAYVGHIHNNWEIKRLKKEFGFIDMINVGVDVWNFKPIGINDIRGRYARWIKKNSLS